MKVKIELKYKKCAKHFERFPFPFNIINGIFSKRKHQREFHFILNFYWIILILLMDDGGKRNFLLWIFILYLSTYEVIGKYRKKRINSNTIYVRCVKDNVYNINIYHLANSIYRIIIPTPSPPPKKDTLIY